MRYRSSVRAHQLSVSGSRYRWLIWLAPEKSADQAFNEVFHPLVIRLLERCDAVLRVGGRRPAPTK